MAILSRTVSAAGACRMPRRVRGTPTTIRVGSDVIWVGSMGQGPRPGDGGSPDMTVAIMRTELDAAARRAAAARSKEAAASRHHPGRAWRAHRHHAGRRRLASGRRPAGRAGEHQPAAAAALFTGGLIRFAAQAGRDRLAVPAPEPPRQPHLRRMSPRSSMPAARPGTRSPQTRTGDARSRPGTGRRSHRAARLVSYATYRSMIRWR